MEYKHVSTLSGMRDHQPYHHLLPMTDEETAGRTAGTSQLWSRTLCSWAENLYPLAQVPGCPEMRALQSPATEGSLSHGSPLRSSLFPWHLFPRLEETDRLWSWGPVHAHEIGRMLP